MTKNKAAQGPITCIGNSFIEDVLSLSDKEILSEYKELYQDEPNAYRDTMVQRFESSLIANNKHLLQVAKAGAASVRAKGVSAHPIDISEARHRLHLIIAHGNDERLSLTLAARKESDLTDEDVLSMLEDFEDLGLMPPTPKKF